MNGATPLCSSNDVSVVALGSLSAYVVYSSGDVSDDVLGKFFTYVSGASLPWWPC